MPTAAATWADLLTRVYLACGNHQPTAALGKHDVDRQRRKQRATAPAKPLNRDLGPLSVAQLDRLIQAAVHPANLRWSLANHADSQHLPPVPEGNLRVP